VLKSRCQNRLKEGRFKRNQNEKGGITMRVFQVIMAILTVFMVFGAFGMSLWINSNFSKGVAIPECYMPINIITTVLVLITVITIFIRK
jgi:succinate dehydrogenase hydrophobic anchor subunit